MVYRHPAFADFHCLRLQPASLQESRAQRELKLYAFISVGSRTNNVRSTPSRKVQPTKQINGPDKSHARLPSHTWFLVDHLDVGCERHPSHEQAQTYSQERLMFASQQRRAGSEQQCHGHKGPIIHGHPQIARP